MDIKTELENEGKVVAKLLDEVAALKKGGREKDTAIMSLDASRAGVSGFYHKSAKDNAGFTFDEQMHAAFSSMKLAEDSFQLNQAYLKIFESKYASEQERTKTLMREIKALGGNDMFNQANQLSLNRRTGFKHLQVEAPKDRTEICTVEFAVENTTICTSSECHIRRLHRSDLKKCLAVDLE